MVTLALDLSSKSSGWAIKVNDKIEYGCISSTSTDTNKRIITMRDGILEVVKKYGVEKIIAEEKSLRVREETDVGNKQKDRAFIRIYYLNKYSPETELGRIWRTISVSLLCAHGHSFCFYKEDTKTL